MSRISDRIMDLQENPAYLEGRDAYWNRISRNPYRNAVSRFYDLDLADAWDLGRQDEQLEAEERKP